MIRTLLWFAFLFVLCSNALQAEATFGSKRTYKLTKEPIDVVIPFSGDNVRMLELCIHGIRKNGHNIRRIIVVSDKKYTDSAEWFDEVLYPFSKFDLAMNIFQDAKLASDFVLHPNSNIGWIYQQLLKLYAAFVIKDISSNILILDADVIFFQPVTFLQENGGALFTPAREYYIPYFEHMGRLLPGLKRVLTQTSGIAHHMLFQREILSDLFKQVEVHNKMPLWKAICQKIDKTKVWECCFSEYEIYFNFAMSRTDQVKVRPLKWAYIGMAKFLPEYEQAKYHFVCCHEYPVIKVKDKI